MSSEKKPLWPNGVRIEVVGACGEYRSGKTLFVCTIDPDPKGTHLIDLEKSGATYAGLGFDRVDFGRLMLERFPRGYKSIDLYETWLGYVRKLPPGKYRVVAVDPITDIEAGLVQWVRENPGHFGYTPQQFARMEGVMWGCVAQHWKMILNDLASRCECFAFTAHMGAVWEGNSPVKGKRKPKGKSVLQELASLYLYLERRPDDKGRVPEKPVGYLSHDFCKDRLCHFALNPDTGELEPHPILPPRIPDCTPARIRKYIAEPANYGKLKKEELATGREMTDDDRAAVRLAIAEAEAETERLRVERAAIISGMTPEQAKAHKAEAAEAKSDDAGKAPVPDPAPAPAPATTPSHNGTHAAPKAEPVPSPPPVPAAEEKPAAPAPAANGDRKPETKTRDQLIKELGANRNDLWKIMGLTGDENRAKREETWGSILAKRNVKSALELSDDQLAELNRNIAHQINCAGLHQGIYGAPKGDAVAGG